MYVIHRSHLHSITHLQNIPLCVTQHRAHVLVHMARHTQGVEITRNHKHTGWLKLLLSGRLVPWTQTVLPVKPDYQQTSLGGSCLGPCFDTTVQIGLISTVIDYRITDATNMVSTFYCGVTCRRVREGAAGCLRRQRPVFIRGSPVIFSFSATWVNGRLMWQHHSPSRLHADIVTFWQISPIETAVSPRLVNSVNFNCCSALPQLNSQMRVLNSVLFTDGIVFNPFELQHIHSFVCTQCLL